MKTGILIPSRGLIHSRTIESIDRNLEDLPMPFYFKKFYTHDLPIPEAQNELVKKTLEWGADYLWFIEEDNLIPDGTFKKMLWAIESHDVGVVAVDYPVGEKNYSTITKKGDVILWCGLGCTLVKKEVFQILEEPWFRTDKSFKIEDGKINLEEVNQPNKYGGHDIYFGVKLNEKGIKIYQLPEVVAGHVKLLEFGNPGFNIGFHKVEIKDNIDNQAVYE